MAQNPTEPARPEDLPAVLGMPLAEARAVIWQGRRDQPRAPMGGLVDAGQVTERDLLWAADRHYNPRVKAAARVLLAHGGAPAAFPPSPGAVAPTVPPAVAANAESVAADEGDRRPAPIRIPSAPPALPVRVAPAPGALAMPEGRFGPEVIVGSRYLEEQELTATARVFLCLGLAVMLVVWLVALLLNPGLPPAAWWRLASAPLVGLPALGVVLAVFWRRAVRFGQGRVGEERVVEALRVALDHRWTIFRNLRLPPRKDDLDVVLIGPGGVWVLEIKAYGGRVRVQGDRWECLRWGQWQPLPANPSRQARGNARRLREWLQQEGVDLRWVQPGVVLARRQRVEDVREADPPVWRLASLRTEVAVCVARWVLSPEMNAQIVGVLSGEAERQRAREEAT